MSARTPYTHPDMTYVSNDPGFWPVISDSRLASYFIVASCAAVVYDWVLTFGPELELVWMKRWSLMTLLYIGVRYVGLLYSIVFTLSNIPITVTDRVRVSDILSHLVTLKHNNYNSCIIFYYLWTWVPAVVNAMLGVIMIARIHAMYGRSRKILIFLVVALLACTIVSAVMTVVSNMGISGEEGILSGYRMCNVEIPQGGVNLIYESSIPIAVWEILAFFLAVWIVIKHFRELRHSPTQSTIEDCFAVLMKSHAFYFLVFVAVACLNLGSLSPNITFSSSVGARVYNGIFTVIQVLQMFVLGPRLILSIRQYHAKLVAGSDEGTAMTSIAFQAGRDVLTGGDV